MTRALCNWMRLGEEPKHCLTASSNSPRDQRPETNRLSASKYCVAFGPSDALSWALRVDVGANDILVHVKHRQDHVDKPAQTKAKSSMPATAIDTLPSFATLTSNSSDVLERALSILFEPSQVLLDHLAPALFSELQNTQSQTSISCYADLIDTALSIISMWPDSLRAQFIAGHPRIGEIKNLSVHSANEQASKPTPPEVLQNLIYLNARYEERYSGLRYVTFVNGRSRAEIAVEMEQILNLQKGDVVDDANASVMPPGSKEWRHELDRAVKDVGRIAKSRLDTLEVITSGSTR